MGAVVVAVVLVFAVPSVVVVDPAVVMMFSAAFWIFPAVKCGDWSMATTISCVKTTLLCECVKCIHFHLLLPLPFEAFGGEGLPVQSA